MTFLIARPKDKAELTLAEFSRYHLKASVLPLIEVVISQEKSLYEQLNSAHPSGILITSTYAAQWLVDLIETKRLLLDLPKIEIICVGKSTARIISSTINIRQVTIASPENSEGILALEYLQAVKQQNIVLLKGHGGRELISKVLLERNANLTVLNVYKRIAKIEAIKAFAFEQSEIKCIIVTSIEITKLLLSSVDKKYLISCQWIVASERIKDYAHSLGIKHITVSQGASNKALLNSANHLVNTGVFND